MLVHQKMSGHLLFGKWRRNNKESKVKDKKQAGVWEKEKWLPDPFSGPLTDPMNRFIRLVFIFKGGEMMALSDLRRFAKVMSGKEEDVLNSRDIAELGPEPLEKDFSFLKFRKLFQGKRGAIKQTLLDQGFISGIGNIYADEILWDTKIHPLFRVEKLSEKQVRDLYRSIRRILSKAIRFRGASIGDYRDSFGREGEYNKHSFAYHRDGLPCRRCGTIIVRMKIGARSAHFCPKCQGDV